ncbi:hypothetical protein [Cohnella sp. AR92]|uniref:hypothetical protein n=1 Tax=Cohnella sp. AR92 TaxID=648716 RepID=UPI001EDF2143|nr:hypothetical protein [Cohnella sp. AR92]
MTKQRPFRYRGSGRSYAWTGNDIAKRDEGVRIKMKRTPFVRPTDHYEERLHAIDEQLCRLLKQRKELSNGNPGFPPSEAIARWAAENNLYEDFLNSMFGMLRNESFFKPQVEPTGFRMHIPVLKSCEQGSFYFTLTSVRQYRNASVVTLYIDWDVNDGEEPMIASRKRQHYELTIGEPYDCRFDTGGSGAGSGHYNYVISPPLPDNLEGIEFIFTEFGRPFAEQGTGNEIRIKA